MEEDAIAQRAMPEKRRRVVQDDDVEQVARHGAPEAAGQPLHRGASIGARSVLVEEHANVEVAVRPVMSRGAAAEQECKPHIRQSAEDVSQPVRG